MILHNYGDDGICTWCGHDGSTPGPLTCLGASGSEGIDIGAVLYGVAKISFTQLDMSRDKFLELAEAAYLQVEQGK